MLGKYRTKEEQEVFLVGEFLGQQSVRFDNLEGLAQRIPGHGERGIAGPDVWAKMEWWGKSLEVAFEVTDYYLDSDSCGSVSTRRRKIWEDVCHRVQKNHPDAPELRNLHVAVAFTSCLPRKCDIKPLANELASFLLSHFPAAKTEGHFYRDARFPNADDFEQYPLLHAHFERISVYDTGHEMGWRRWHCADATSIGISPPEITRVICEKTEKFPKYDVAGADECWLLICAGGKSSANRAGLPEIYPSSLNEESLVAAVEQAPFRKVILWDRVDSRCVELKEKTCGIA